MSCNSGCARATYSNNIKIADPSGCWEYDQLIGAKVRVRSMPVSNFFNTFDASQLYVIKEIYFRISIDGKAITVVKLEGLDDKFFTLKDLMIVEVCYHIKYKATCGEFLCNQTLVGHEVDRNLTINTDTIDTSPVTIMDDSGNLITGKLIRISGSQISIDEGIGLVDIKLNGDII